MKSRRTDKDRMPLPPVTVVATAGPALGNAVVLREIAKLGRVVFRINGAHGSPEQIEEIMLQITRAVRGARILLDLPGRKIRITGLDRPLDLRAGVAFSLTRDQFTQGRAFDLLKTGQEIIANDGRARLTVIRRTRSRIEVVPETDGMLGNNKGIHIGAALADMPLFGDRDRLLLRHARKWPVTHVGLSFVCHARDVEHAHGEMRRLGLNVVIWPKIETAPALENLGELLLSAETFILDRGDLASEIGLLNLSAAQDRILRETEGARVQLVIATQLLKSMEENPIPTIAEITGIHHLLARGVFAVQLSEETAVGRYPVGCVRLIMEMSRRFLGAQRPYS